MTVFAFQTLTFSSTFPAVTVNEPLSSPTSSHDLKLPTLCSLTFSTHLSEWLYFFLCLVSSRQIMTLTGSKHDSIFPCPLGQNLKVLIITTGCYFICPTPGFFLKHPPHYSSCDASNPDTLSLLAVHLRSHALPFGRPSPQQSSPR